MVLWVARQLELPTTTKEFMKTTSQASSPSSTTSANRRSPRHGFQDDCQRPVHRSSRVQTEPSPFTKLDEEF
ncbi:hypothetical protein PFLUV_G00182360 [Perca fluviatilis]|uniref:Uncharacterized protein n=1 Tax=Perca fluviatilis TaxID=8168 RepID=A0A6A5EGT7_PERFL|nr:hypothetical protein PFLUV_G00182360 [Perca fluviatilis]